VSSSDGCVSESVDASVLGTRRGRESAATAMVRLARASYSIVRDAGNKSLYAIPESDGDPVPLERLAFALARAYERETGKVPPSTAAQAAIEILADEDAPITQVTAPEPTVAERDAADAERLAILEHEAAELIACGNVLAMFRNAVREAGWVGETTAPELVYANAYTALLAVGEFKPVKRLGSLRIGGPSSAGKNYAVERAETFLPEDLFHHVTSSSEKSLFYSPINLRRKFLYYPEGAALQSDGVGVAVLRSLLTENVVVHETVLDGQWVRLEKEGPTGAMIATSRVALDGDLENRLDHIEISDTANQTRAVIDAIGASAEFGHWEPPDVTRWHAYYNWLRLQGPCEVIVPYATELAAAIPAAAIRLRRDVSQLIGLIWAHTVMHLPQRERDSRGRLIATLADYAGVRTLINAGIGIATGQTVPAWMLPTWDALPNEGGMTYRELPARLQLGDDGAKKRVEKMIPLGYADNLETRPRAAAKLIRKLRPPDRDETGFLPTANEIEERLTRGPSLAMAVGHPGSSSDRGRQADFESDLARTDKGSDAERCTKGPTSDSKPNPSESDAEPAAAVPSTHDPTDPTDAGRRAHAHTPEVICAGFIDALTRASTVHIDREGRLVLSAHGLTGEQAVLRDADALVAGGPRLLDRRPASRPDHTREARQEPGAVSTNQAVLPEMPIAPAGDWDAPAAATTPTGSHERSSR
jgi:hypothetical protein